MLTQIQQLTTPRYWPAWLGLGVLWLLTRLPYRMSLMVGKGIGSLLYYLPGKLKKITEINIRLCFPELTQKEQTQLIKKNFQSLGMSLVETGMAWWLPDKKLTHLLRMTGTEHVIKAIEKGHGVILLSPHLTTLEMIGRLIGMHYSFAVMYRPHKKSLIAYLHKRFRQKYGGQMISNHEMRKLIRTLQEKTAVWYAYDVDGGEKRSVFAPFFNVQTASLTAVSRLAELTNAVVIPISFYRDEPNGCYKVNISPPLENFPTQDSIKDAARLNALLEKAIRHKPEQYVWQYKRFKTRPNGEQRFY